MIIELNDEAWTAKHTIAQVNEIIDHVEHVVVALKMKDGSTQTMVSYMPNEMLALLNKRLDMRLEWTLIEEHMETDCPFDGDRA